MRRAFLGIAIAACGGSSPSRDADVIVDADTATGDAAPTTAFCEAPPAPAGATYWVATGGNDTAAGSEAAPLGGSVLTLAPATLVPAKVWELLAPLAPVSVSWPPLNTSGEPLLILSGVLAEKSEVLRNGSLIFWKLARPNLIPGLVRRPTRSLKAVCEQSLS